METSSPKATYGRLRPEMVPSAEIIARILCADEYCFDMWREMDEGYESRQFMSKATEIRKWLLAEENPQDA